MCTVYKKLCAKDVACLSGFFGRRKNLTCDSVIFDSFLWQDYFDLAYHIWDGRALLLRMRDKDGYFSTVPICDEETLPEAFAELEREYAEVGAPFRVCWVDEEALEILKLPPEKYSVTEIPDQADYLYDAEKLRTLAGKKYHKKKNHLNAFLKEYEGRWEYRRLHRWSRCEIWSFLTRWEEDKENIEEHMEAEMTGLHHYLFNMDVFDAVMAGIYIDGRLEAFTIGSYNKHDRMSVVHVEKANKDIRGLYVLISQQFQIHEFPDALLVNREDDVGIPALRAAKLSWQPVAMARKYDITHAVRQENGAL
ncbi:MAG: DUF2156 domain-containing protein [Lachnospiraceae bacterium]|nr:DUF2156 domain-containing protein [Lachnospiraceae bacterium]